MSKGRNYLLDTMAILWFAFLPRRLPRAAREVILDRDIGLSFSAVSMWEIGLKMSVSGYYGFQLPDDWEICIPEGLKQQGAIFLNVEVEHSRRIQDLPFHHRDPFDRMLAAQCQIEGMSMISSDVIFDSYGVRRIW
jgi:PIN domain nuclease of toxin-antitoxin system